MFLDGEPYATNQYEFSADGLLLGSVNALGHGNIFVYGQHGRLEISTDAHGFAATNYYDDTTDLLIAGSDALGNVTSNFFDSRSLLAGTRDAIGTRTTNYFDDLGNLLATATLNAGGVVLSTNSFAYDLNGNQTNSVVWRQVNSVWTGATNTLIYDAQNRVVQTLAPNGGTNTIVINAIGRQEATIDKLERVTNCEYDAPGRLFRTTYPDDTFTLTGYDAAGRRVAETNQAGVVIRYGYDAVGRLIATTNAFGTAEEAVTRTVFDGLGRVQFSVDARGVTNALGYDRLGRRVAVTNAWDTPEATSSLFGFDANGNQVFFTNALDVVTTNVFDELNRLTQVQFADGTMTSTGYDAVGRRVAETNQDSIVTLYGYDGAGRLSAVTNASGTGQQTVTRYEYDEAGNQTAQSDALERETLFEHDALGRRVKRTLPGNQSETFGYDLAGSLTAHTNFNGTVITNQYDVMNRLWKRWNEGTLLETYLYSATGRLTNRADASGAHEWVYDARERVRTNTTPVGTLYYTWDANGNQLSLQSATTDGVDLAYEHDSLNRLTNVVDNRLTGTKNTAYTFDGVGNLASLEYPNGITNYWQYDSLNRLTNLTWKLNGAARADFAYQLGAAGHRTNLTETVNGVSRSFAWQFDNLYRLTNETVTGASPTGSLGYGYDAVGNRLSRTGTLAGLSSQTLDYSVNDWIDNDANPDNGSTYFDANGNTTSLDGAFDYDWANRLTNYNSGAATFVHDAAGNRIKKVASGVTTWYLVATVNPSGWPQVVEEHTGSSPGTVTRRYTYGMDLISQSRWTGSAWETHFYLVDGLGSTRALLNSSGTNSDTYGYDAYGTLIASSGSTPNDYLFAGEQWDTTLGQYYLRARTMHPGYGRFWTRDSFEGVQSDPLSLHKYLYAADDPVNFIDPSGQSFIADVSIAIGARLFVFGGRIATTFPRAVAIAKATVTFGTLATLVANEDARIAFLATGNPGAAVVGLTDDVVLLVYRSGRLIQRTASSLARSGVMSNIEAPLEAAALRIKNIADDAIVGYRGSVASGVKQSTQGPFDPTDFDLDGFIVSDKLARQISGRFRNGRDVAGVADEADKVENVLKEFSGYRCDPSKPFTFRVWTTEEFERIMRDGPHVTF